MTTAARVHTTKEASWYTTAGDPLYEIPKADGKGTRAPTLADAKKRGDLLPRVTTILNLLDKPALNDWKLEQGILAVMTTPQLPGEPMDAFIHRVLHIERVQDEESAVARDKGTDMHAALEARMRGQGVSPDLLPWIEPAAKAIEARGQYITSEKILVGDGYAGRCDLLQEAPDCWLLSDYKTSRTMPDPKKGAYHEHRLQLASYAAAFHKSLTDAGITKPILTCNVYISTVVQGAFLICDHDPDWQRTYNQGFKSLVTYWQWLTGYKAQQI
jgi:hypothetical protein